MIEYYPKKNRATIEQLTDYRIFIVTAYRKDEINEDLTNSLKSQGMIGKDFPTPYLTYSFYKYAIDEYVQSVSISRAMDGNPASLTLKVFPEFDKIRNEYNFMYRCNDTLYPVFRRMD